MANVFTQTCGLKPGDHLTLILPRVPEWWLVALSCIRTGQWLGCLVNLGLAWSQSRDIRYCTSSLAQQLGGSSYLFWSGTTELGSWWVTALFCSLFLIQACLFLTLLTNTPVLFSSLPHTLPFIHSLVICHAFSLSPHLSITHTHKTLSLAQTYSHFLKKDSMPNIFP